MRILVLNAGSSSLKCSFYDVAMVPSSGPAPKPLWEAQASWTKLPGEAEFEIKTEKETVQEKAGIHSLRHASQYLARSLWTGEARVVQSAKEVDVIGHRVVHGGSRFQESTFITPEVREAIAELAELAPEHNPLALEGIEGATELFGPDAPQVAVFDTAFHATLSPAAYTYPGPYEWLDQKIRRYGFHGISYQYTSRRAAEILRRDLRTLRLVICHLGNGCSLAAIKEGASVNTTMGFTPLEGLMMGSRSGSIDPGILIYLLKHRRYTADALDELLNQKSGLKGLSGISSDMRQILQAIKEGNAQAQLAFDVYIHRLQSEICSMLPALGELDALVFTAGVGENSTEVRSAACRDLSALGIRIDEEKNLSAPRDADIGKANAKVRILVIHTQEAWEIARECMRLAS